MPFYNRLGFCTRNELWIVTAETVYFNSTETHVLYVMWCYMYVNTQKNGKNPLDSDASVAFAFTQCEWTRRHWKVQINPLLGATEIYFAFLEIFSALIKWFFFWNF